jgi:uncharacterized membrane-anchored protein
MADVASKAVPAGVRGALNGALASKVPQVTVFFWIIKILCTTVGETASDFLSVNMGLGLKGTSVAAGVCLALVLLVQFRAKRYIPAVYWLAVVLISVFGTLITDILTDSLHFPLEASTVIFSVALGLTFGAWYAKEGTLSIHSIFTARREAFYWLAILFTFALGTATGDLVAEKLGVGYLFTGLIVLGVIAAAHPPRFHRGAGGDGARGAEGARPDPAGGRCAGRAPESRRDRLLRAARAAREAGGGLGHARPPARRSVQVPDRRARHAEPREGRRLERREVESQ